MSDDRRVRDRPACIVFNGFVLFFAGAVEGAGTPWFTEVTSAAGIVAPHAADQPSTGIAIADFDRNGWPDIFVTGYFEPNRLYFNQGDGSFNESATVAAEVALTGAACSGTAAADFDDDGWPDLYLACNGRNYLLRNLAGQGFADATTPVIDHPGRSEAVAWGDLNGDGRLDLFVGAHPIASPPPAPPPDYCHNPDAAAIPLAARGCDLILLGDGTGGFTDITSGLDPRALDRLTLAAQWIDYDNDGDVDLYVLSDKLFGNVLWRNDGPGCGGVCLTDVSFATGADRPAYSMGIAAGDFDRDGDFDFYYSSIGEQVMLESQVAGGAGGFLDITAEAGTTYPAIGWGAVFLDADLDGFEDLALAVSGGAQGTPVARNRLFHNLGTWTAGGFFTDVSVASGLDVPLPTEAAARLDYDLDGRPDLVLGHFNQHYGLYRNITGGANQWLGLVLEGGSAADGGRVNRDALGARVILTTPDGAIQLRESASGASRGSSHDRRLHFGLGTDDRATVQIRWPDGTLDDLGERVAGRYYYRVWPPAETIFADSFD